MPNKVVTRTQVPVEAKDIYFEASAHTDAGGVYDRHQIRVTYQPVDDQGKPINGRRDFQDIPLTAQQKSALASFVQVLVAAANATEGT